MTGLTPKEAEVMDLWDAGASVADIATATGKSPSGVEALTSTYSFEGRDIIAEAAMRKGSNALAAAIRANMPEQIASGANCSEAA